MTVGVDNEDANLDRRAELDPNDGFHALARAG
jgi:hypothetical protein